MADSYSCQPRHWVSSIGVYCSKIVPDLSVMYSNSHRRDILYSRGNTIASVLEIE